MTTRIHLAVTELYSAWLAAPHKTATLRAVTEHFQAQLPPGAILGKPCRKHGHTWNGTPWCLRKHSKCVECEAVDNPVRTKARRQRPDVQARERMQRRLYEKANPSHQRKLKRFAQCPELKARDLARKRYYDHVRRSRLYGVKLLNASASDVRERFQQFGNRCAYCGSSGVLHIEHFLPISKGGAHVLSNVIPACQPCNLGKQDRDPEAWYKSQSFFTKQRWRTILRVLGKQRMPVGQLSLA